MGYSPIALFVFNRPEHTKQTINALIDNIDAKKSDLYIFSDAAKSDKDHESVKEVRKIISEVRGFNKIEIIERDANYGLAKSIIEGVTKLCSQEGRIIVLEDDLVTSRYFIQYMNNALDKYEATDNVMHISGYMFPIESDIPDSFFLPTTSSWGWATWNSTWKYFEPNGLKLYKKIEEKKLFYDFNIHDSYNYKKMLKKQITGKIDSWAIRWYASVFLREGLGLFPACSLVQNIGHDDSGVHCSTTSNYDVELSDATDIKMPLSIGASEDMLEKMAQYYKKNDISFYKKVITRIKKVITK